jgi:opacity protein-like surface antigen
VELSLASYGDKSRGAVESEVDMMSALGLARFDLKSNTSKDPYLLAGLGLTRTDIDVSVNPALGVIATSNDDTSPAVLIGVGVDVPFNKLTLGVEARYQHVFFDIGNVDGGGALQLLAQLRF